MYPNILKLVGITELELPEVEVDSMIFIHLGHRNKESCSNRVHFENSARKLLNKVSKKYFHTIVHQFPGLPLTESG